jgi:hypothetical protein
MNSFTKSVCTFVRLWTIFIVHLACRIVRRGWAMSLRLVAHLQYHTLPAVGRRVRQAYARVAPVIARVIHNLRVRAALLLADVARRFRRQPTDACKAAAPVATWTRHRE